MSQQSTYPQQHEPWRPDYPPVWNNWLKVNKKPVMIDIDEPINNFLHYANVCAFNITRNSIVGAMKQ